MGKGNRELMWNLAWGNLARYNDEVAHGIVHTPEYDALMAEQQDRFADFVRRGAKLEELED